MSKKDKDAIQHLGGSTSVPTGGSASAPKWTPGPWRTNEFGWINAPYGNGEIEIAVTSGRLPHEREANARLIAAAPELYEIVAALMDTWQRDFPDGGPPSPLHDKARAALAKARGTSPE